MTDRVQTVQQLYSAFAEGDASRLGELLADTQWIEAEGMPYGGTYRGFGEIAANVFGPITSDVQGFTAKPDEIITRGRGSSVGAGNLSRQRIGWRSRNSLCSSLDGQGRPRHELRSVC